MVAAVNVATRRIAFMCTPLRVSYQMMNTMTQKIIAINASMYLFHDFHCALRGRHLASAEEPARSSRWVPDGRRAAPAGERRCRALRQADLPPRELQLPEFADHLRSINNPAGGPKAGHPASWTFGSSGAKTTG
jgi:hypothetical protein